MKPVNRFEKFVMPAVDGCHYWIGAISNRGRGRFSYNGVNCLAPRIAYEFYKGVIPDGLFVCHSCDNGLCVNPDHLFLGTNQDNINDKVKRGRQSRLHGSTNPNAKLIDSDVINIFQLKGNKSATDVAFQYKVYPKTILDIWNGLSWRNLNLLQNEK